MTISRQIQLSELMEVVAGYAAFVAIVAVRADSTDLLPTLAGLLVVVALAMALARRLARRLWPSTPRRYRRPHRAVLSPAIAVTVYVLVLAWFRLYPDQYVQTATSRLAGVLIAFSVTFGASVAWIAWPPDPIAPPIEFVPDLVPDPAGDPVVHDDQPRFVWRSGRRP